MIKYTCISSTAEEPGEQVTTTLRSGRTHYISTLDIRYLILSLSQLSSYPYPITSEVGLADLGVYVCKADNKLGDQEAAVFLHGEHQQHHIHKHLHFRITIIVLNLITIIIWFITIWETKIMYCRKTDEKEEWRSENKRENPEDNRLEPGLSNVDGQLKQSFWYHTWWTITINVEYRSKTYASCD